MHTINIDAYVLVYSILVFFCPWCVFIIYVICELRFLSKNNVYVSFDLNPIRALQKVSKFRKENEKSKFLYGKVKKWLIIMLISWVIGFMILVITFFILDKNNLLINHSSGTNCSTGMECYVVSHCSINKY